MKFFFAFILSSLFFSIFRECKYEQDLEFSATSRQLNYRRAKEERQKKIKRLKQLQKIQQGQKRRTMKRVNALHIRCALLYTTVGKNHSKLLKLRQFWRLPFSRYLAKNQKRKAFLTSTVIDLIWVSFCLLCNVTLTHRSQNRKKGQKMLY